MSSCRSEDPYRSACLSDRACDSGLLTPSQPGPLTSTRVRKRTPPPPPPEAILLQLLAWLAACANVRLLQALLSCSHQVSGQVKVRCLLSEGAWENQGLGVVKAVGDELVWTYTASHLGHWVAAPLPSSEGKDRRVGPVSRSALRGSAHVVCLSGHLGYRLSLELVWYHTYLLMGTLGATLLVVIGFLSFLVCHCR